MPLSGAAPPEITKRKLESDTLDMGSKIVQKIFNIEIFQFVFMVASFFYCMPLTNPYVVPFFKIFLIWGALCFGYNCFFNKQYTIRKIDYWLFAFLLLAGVGCLISGRNLLVANVASVLYLFIQTVLMISYTREKDFNRVIRHIKRFSMTAILLTFVCAVVSLMIFLFNFKYSYALNDCQVLFGVFEGRLWGIQGNPNSLAQFSLISIWLSFLVLAIHGQFGRGRGLPIFLMINIFLEAICCVLSNSRGSAVGACVSLLVGAVFWVAYKRKQPNQSVGKSIVKHWGSTLLTVGCVLLALVCFTVSVQKIMPICARPFQNADANFMPEGDDEAVDEAVTAEREYETSDVTNGRFEVWGGAFQVILEAPLFGVSVKNVNDRINAHLSEAMLAEYPSMAANTHNIFIQVWTAHGSLALVVFLGYLFIVYLRRMLRLLRFCGRDGRSSFVFTLSLICFCLLCGLLAINLFDSNILYFCSTFIVPIFWVTLGNLNRLDDFAREDEEKEKLLILIDSLEMGGAEKALVDLTDRLDYTRYQVCVQTIYNEGPYIQQLHPAVQYTSVIRKPSLWKKRIFYRLVKYLPGKWLYQLTISEAYDIEIAFHELLSTKIISGSSQPSLKLAWVHTNMFAEGHHYQMFGTYRRFVRGYQQFDRIACVSDNIRRDFNQRTKLYTKTETVYSPIPVAQIEALSQEPCPLQKRSGSFLVVSVGRLEPVKGYDGLLQIVSRLRQQHPQLELWLIGDGSQRGAYEQFIQEHQLTDYVRLVGAQSNPYSYMKQADLFISTSHVEGFGLAVAEAVVLGVPILSTATDGPKEILDNGQYGLLVDDQAAIEAALTDILQNPPMREALAEQSRARQAFLGKMAGDDRVAALLHLTRLPDLQASGQVFCTVFTPTYNRGHLLGDLYASLRRQTCRDFEWVIVDDGSTDDTEALVAAWQQDDLDFEITYLKVPNGGKQRAINRGLDLAKGKFFFIADSDDQLTDVAIERIAAYTATIQDQTGFAGVAGLKGRKTDGTVIGSRPNKPFVDCTNLERKRCHLLGDKAEVYKTDVLRAYRFPEIEGERFVTECVIWDQIAYDGYQLRWFDEIIYLGDYLPGGLTDAGQSLYHKNPVGYLIFVRHEAIYHRFDWKRRMGHYYRYYSIVKADQPLATIAQALLIPTWVLRLIVTVYKCLGR